MLLRTWDNQFDWWSLFIVFMGAAFQTGIYLSIVLTFKVAHQAGLNIGIAQAIWSINPFMISLLERVVYGVAFNFKQFYGMFCLVLCALLVSLSQVIAPATVDPSLAGSSPADQTPLWVAVLCSCIMPLVCTFFIIVIKHSNETLMLDAKDWTIAYWGLASLVFQICGIVSFMGNEGSFDMAKWVNGFIASLFNLIGSLFAISSYATGCPIGPCSALITTQTIVVVVASAILTQTMPPRLQIIGLLFGIFGAMLLTIPEQLYDLYYRVTRCRQSPSSLTQSTAKGHQ